MEKKKLFPTSDLLSNCEHVAQTNLKCVLLVQVEVCVSLYVCMLASV